jgi:hypothetical protein
MKIMVICDKCGRDFLLSQLVDGPAITGRCPWCGDLVAPGYVQMLPELIRQAENAGYQLGAAIKHLRGDWTHFRIRTESILGPLETALAGEETTGVPLRHAA